ncbi:ABC transporter permease subunit, partial [Vibrio vulnificus]
MDAVKSFALKHLKESAIYAVLLILLAVIVIQEPSFLSLRNLSNILTQSSVRVIIALGVAGLIVTQGTDLSAGRQVGLAAVISATLLQSIDNVNKVFPGIGEVPIVAVIICVCLIGAIIGLVNGVIVAYLKVTPFIATLGTMIIVYGINSLYYDAVGASPIAGFDERFTTFTQGFINLGGFRFSYITFYAIIAIIFMWVLWNKTVFGKNIFAVGGNPEAAKVS